MPQLRKRVFVVAFAKEQVPSAAERLAALPTWVDSLCTGWPRRDLADFLLALDHPDLLQELSKQKLAMEAPRSCTNSAHKPDRPEQPSAAWGTQRPVGTLGYGLQARGYRF